MEEKVTTKNPDEVLMQDFISIGFEGGVKTALAEIQRIYPQLAELELNADALRTKWADEVAAAGELIGFNRHGHEGQWEFGHGWAFRWIAFAFISYMESIGADRYVKQQMEINSSLKSGQRWLMVEVYYQDWWRKHQQVQEGKAAALEKVQNAAANLLDSKQQWRGESKVPAEQLRLALNEALDWLEKEAAL